MAPENIILDVDALLQEVRERVRQRTTDAPSEKRNGFAGLASERTLDLLEFDEERYRELNPDADAEISRGVFGSAFAHWFKQGRAEGKTFREPGEPKPAAFDEVDYLAANPDISHAVSLGAFDSGYEHWEKHGRLEGRSLRPSPEQLGAALRQRCDQIEDNRVRIGQLPPAPPNLRGSIGAVPAGIIRRALFWYTAQIQAAQASISRAFEVQAKTTEGIVKESSRNRKGLFNLSWFAVETYDSTQKKLRELSSGQDRWETQFSRVAAQLERMHDLVRSHEAKLERDGTRLDQIQAKAEDALGQARHANHTKKSVNDLTKRAGQFEVALQSLHAVTAQMRKQLQVHEEYAEAIRKLHEAQQGAPGDLQTQNDRITQVKNGLEEVSGSLETFVRTVAGNRTEMERELRQLEGDLLAGVGARGALEQRVGAEEAAQRATGEGLRMEVGAREALEQRVSVDEATLRMIDEWRGAEAGAREATERRLAAEITTRENLEGLFHTESQVWQSLMDRVQETEKYAHQSKTELIFQQRRVSLLLEEARKRLPAPFTQKQLEKFVEEETHEFDALYVNFEDVFRGTRDDIKNRVRVYLPYLKKANAEKQKTPILDLGCGRGEWLELLQEEGLDARGVDRNRMMVEQCQQFGFKVLQGDALEHIRQVPDASLGAVTAFHVIEHLPFAELMALLDESVRVLRPGGLVILETPNPSNMLVGSHSFYLDPTHLHPLPSALMQFLTEARGLCNVEVLALHPYPDFYRLPDQDNASAQRLNEHFYGPQDYAIIGRKA